MSVDRGAAMTHRGYTPRHSRGYHARHSRRHFLLIAASGYLCALLQNLFEWYTHDCLPREDQPLRRPAILQRAMPVAAQRKAIEEWSKECGIEISEEDGANKNEETRGQKEEKSEECI